MQSLGLPLTKTQSQGEQVVRQSCGRHTIQGHRQWADLKLEAAVEYHPIRRTQQAAFIPIEKLQHPKVALNQIGNQERCTRTGGAKDEMPESCRASTKPQTNENNNAHTLVQMPTSTQALRNKHNTRLRGNKSILAKCLIQTAHVAK